MTLGIDDHFSNGPYGKFISLLSNQPVYLRASADVAEHKLIGSFDLFIQRPGVLLFINELIPVIPFKKSTLDLGKWKIIAGQKNKSVGCHKFSF